MEAARPRGRRRRARRGTVDRPVNSRLVRVAFLVVLPAFLALLFSITVAGTLPRPPLEPLFDVEAAAALATQLSTEYPSRVPGTLEASGAARWYQETISAYGFTTEDDVWRENVADLGDVELHNLVTVVPGRSEEAIILVAHRDNAGTQEPLGDNATGTAALIEVARGFAPQGAVTAPLPQRTLVLVSTDGGAYGGAGAVRFADTSPYTKAALAVIVLDGLGGRGRPELAVAGSAPRSPAPPLVSTAAARVREETGTSPALPSVLTQLVDLGVPYAAREQGPFLAQNVAAVTLTTEGASDVPIGEPEASLPARRLGELGRATEALVGSIDLSAGAAFRAPDRLFLDGRVASGWAVRLTLVVAVVPYALGVLDLLVRSRRRRLPLAPAARALRTRLLFWLYAGFLLWVGSLTGIFPRGASLALPPYASFLSDWSAAGLLLLGVALVLGWLVGRRRLVPTVSANPDETLAGYAIALAWLALVAILIGVLHPYGLVFVLPSLYAWLWLPLRTRPWTRAALYGVGLAGPIVGLLVLANQLGLTVRDAPLYVAGLVTVGYIPLASVLLMLAWAASAAQLGALAFGRYAPYAAGAEPPPPSAVRTSLLEVARRARRAPAQDSVR